MVDLRKLRSSVKLAEFKFLFDRKWRSNCVSFLAQFNDGRRGLIKVVCYGHYPDRFLRGEKWKFSGRFYAYNYRFRFSGALYVNSTENNSSQIESAHWMSRKFYSELRDCFSEVLGRGIDKSGIGFSVSRAMLLGERDGISKDLQSDFINSGTLHLFALSGLHVGVIAILLIAILKVFGITRIYWGAILIPLLFDLCDYDWRARGYASCIFDGISLFWCLWLVVVQMRQLLGHWLYLWF